MVDTLSQLRRTLQAAPESLQIKPLGELFPITIAMDFTIQRNF